VQGDARVRKAWREPKTELTPAEARVLELLVTDAATNGEIAKTLGISENTVKIHMKRIMDKTGFSTRLELAVRTLQKRIHQE
jgi:two-component system vancomycin resistance associated response regulator VraR